MLRYFVAVAEERHFGRAAQRLHMAQPPLSQSIKQLERQLGTPLLTRTTRKVEVNAPGEMLLNRGRHLLAELDLLARDVRRVGMGLEGSVRLGFTGTMTYGLMPEVVRATGSDSLGIELMVSGEHLTPELEAQLLSRRIDIAVLRPPHDSELLEHLHITDEPLVAALPADSALTAHETLQMHDLVGVPLVGYPVQSAVSRTLAGSAQGALHYAHHVPETSTLLSLVSAGMGVGIVPESATALGLGGVVFRPIVDAPSIGLSLAWRKDETSAAVLRYIPFLREVILRARGERP